MTVLSRPLIIASTLLLSGCTAVSRVATVGPGGPQEEFARLEVPANAAVSLFREDEAVMSSEELQRALSWSLNMPEKAKIAVVRVGQRPYWWGWSETFVRMTEQIDADFINRLASSERVKEVAYLPSMITPREMTIPKLRQAAARFQADLLLIYHTNTRSYDREKFLAPAETRAYCTVEAVLLDTRSGIIPFSAVVNETFSAKRTSHDVDFSETVAKANQQAIGKAWLKMADQVNGFFVKLPNAMTNMQGSATKSQ